MTEAQQRLAENQPGPALKALEQEVRAKPADASLRLALVRVLTILGDWDRVLKQLGVVAEMGATEQITARSMEQMVICERVRLEVFAGRQKPTFFGKPEVWSGMLVSALEQLSQSNADAGLDMAGQAFELAPAVSGRADGASFAWIADADMRLGPVLEVVIQGSYYWLAMDQIRAIDLPEPSSLSDLVWLPVDIELADQSTLPAMLFTRYPGSEHAQDGAVQMARKTDWLQPAEGYYLGLGQRMLTTDQGDLPLLDVRRIEWNTPLAVSASAATPAPQEQEHDG